MKRRIERTRVTGFTLVTVILLFLYLHSKVVFNSLEGAILLALACIFVFARRIEREKQNALKQLATTERRLQEIITVQNAILDSANYIIISTDIDGTICSFNTAAQQRLGYTAKGVVGKVTPAIFHDADELACRARELNREYGTFLQPSFDVFIANSQPRIVGEQEWTYIRKDGSRFPVQLSVTALYKAEGNLIGYLIVGTDITERRQVEEALQHSESRLQAVVNTAVDGIITIDSLGSIQSFNPAAEHIFGYTEAEVIGRNVSILMPEPYHPAHDGYLTHHLQTGEKKVTGIGREVEGQRKDGTTFPLDLAVSSVEQGGETLFVGIVRDITGRKQVAEALRHSEARLEEAQAVARIGFWEFDANTLEIFWSNESFRILDFDPTQGTPHYEDLMARYHPDDVPMHARCVREAIIHNKPYEFDIRIVAADGSIRWVQTIGKPICDEDGEVVRLVGTLRDITGRKEAEQQLQEANGRLEALATIDGMTGLKNHRTFQDQIKREYSRSVRYEAPLSLVLLDVDKFKQFNDTFGHLAGDAVLKKVAEALMAVARTTDVVARYGGEEFVVILPETDAEQALAAAERFREAIEAVPWQERPVTASFGVATRHDSLTSTDALIAEADAALYRSKRRGRNCVTHADDLVDGVEVQREEAVYAVVSPSHHELKEHGLVLVSEAGNDALVHAYDATIESWSRILDMRDKETEGHSARVTEMTVCLARSLDLSAEEILYARWGALLHDIGKMGVPDSILLKPGKLTPEEWEVMCQHPTIAYEMLSPVAFLRPALDIPHCHHEKWDGSGYPRGLKEEEIPLAARLFAVIDVYDALRSDRPYREAWSEEGVCAYLREQAGTHFDPGAVEAFLKMLQERNSSQQSSPLSRAA